MLPSSGVEPVTLTQPIGPGLRVEWLTRSVADIGSKVAADVAVRTGLPDGLTSTVHPEVRLVRVEDRPSVSGVQPAEVWELTAEAWRARTGR